MKIITDVIIKSFLLCSFLFLVSANAQQLSKEQIKTAYIYNFLKHINWPEEDKKAQFVIGVYQDKDFHALLKRSLLNKKIKNKNISVLLVGEFTQASKNDLFYLPEQFNNQLTHIANTIRSSQTLLVTNNSAEKQDTMLNLIDSNDTDAISFEVNKSNIIYEELTTSAQLLLLGGTELDIAYLYRKTEEAMQATRERELALNTELTIQQNKLNQTSAKLNKLNEDLQRSSREIKQQQSAMKELINSEKIKEEELANTLQQLSQANDNYSIQTKAVTEKKLEVEVKEKEKLKMANLIEQNKLILQKQQQSIKVQQQKLSKQQQELNKQQDELAAQKRTIVTQKETITITTVLGLIVAFAFLLVAGLFLKNRKTTQKLTETLNHLEEAQTQLVQSEKMASLGKLIAGVAHEINTPLGIAVTSTSLIQENTEEIAKQLNDKSLSQKKLQSYIGRVTESSMISNQGLERVIELMHNFKEVAADQIVENVREINIANYVGEVMTTLASELKKSKVNYLFSGENNIKISTVPGALAQVITNLVNNSIRHGFQDEKKERPKINEIKINLKKHNDNKIILTYQDNGIGMSDDVLAQVFDPFFTTKRNKGGTGLGMNIVFNVIEQKLAGHINISSKLGKGVTCEVTLPLSVTAD